MAVRTFEKTLPLIEAGKVVDGIEDANDSIESSVDFITGDRASREHSFRQLVACLPKHFGGSFDSSYLVVLREALKYASGAAAEFEDRVSGR